MYKNQEFNLLPFNSSNDDGEEVILQFGSSDSDSDSSDVLNTSDINYINDDSESEDCRSSLYPTVSAKDFLKKRQDRKEERQEKKKLRSKSQMEIRTSNKPSTLGKKLLEDESFFDVLFKTNDNVEISAHKCVLVATSEYFAKMFNGQFKEQNNKIIPIQVAFFFGDNSFFALQKK